MNFYTENLMKDFQVVTLENMVIGSSNNLDLLIASVRSANTLNNLPLGGVSVIDRRTGAMLLNRH
jgi:hypothetical protein